MMWFAAQTNTAAQPKHIEGPAWRWNIDSERKFVLSSGYKQFIRRTPILSSSQSLDLKTRGISFERGRAD
jgi:hypothetical protein